MFCAHSVFIWLCSCSWFSGLKSNFKNNLQTTQNKILRFITNQGPRSHVGQYERSQIGYLSVEDRVKFLRLCHTHKIFYNISAPYLHDNFVRVTEVHRYNTRSSSFNFRVPNSVPSKALCREIGSALWKIGSTDFLKMCKQVAFSYQISLFSVKTTIFGSKTLLTFCQIGPSWKPLEGTLVPNE